MVALSGGVDSATTAWLLKHQGIEARAMFMKNWEGDDPSGACTAEQDAADARAVAEALDMPFYARNFATEYWEQVFEHFLQELEKGRTPNPDILCNREIKFNAFLDHAISLGATSMATGHYARRRVHADGSVSLLKGVDHNKDQSYFLYALDQYQLGHARFPLGELTKPEVRDMAKQAALPVADKKDSTGICFIGERRFDSFVDDYLKGTPGEILTVDGKRIGQHTGLMHYTLGQRKGLAIGGLRDFPESPWFVAHKALETNTLYVTQDTQDKTLLSDQLWADQVHWIAGHPPKEDAVIAAKIRYRQPDQACRVMLLEDGTLKVDFEAFQRAVTPGQSIVFYEGEVCLGGAIIDRGNAAAPSALTKERG